MNRAELGQLVCDGIEIADIQGWRAREIDGTPSASRWLLRHRTQQGRQFGQRIAPEPIVPEELIETAELVVAQLQHAAAEVAAQPKIDECVCDGICVRRLGLIQAGDFSPAQTHLAMVAKEKRACDAQGYVIA